MTKQTNIQDLLNLAAKAGFDSYASFNEGLQHDILLCNKGEYDGEVIDIYWNWETGKIHTIDHSCQFKGQTPKIKF